MVSITPTQDLTSNMFTNSYEPFAAVYIARTLLFTGQTLDGAAGFCSGAAVPGIAELG